MKNKNLIILISVLLIVLIASSSALYHMLSDQMSPDNLLVMPNNGNTPSGTVAPEAPVDTDTTDSTESNASRTDSSETPDSAENSSPFMAPDFTVYNEDGTAVHLSDFLGKPVVLNFWASWCGPCKMEMPAFEEMYKEYGETVHFIMVNLTDGARETVEIATTFLDANDYTFPVYYDKDSDAALTYQVYGIPVTYFINAEGHLIAQGSSALNAETIQKGIDMILE